MIPDEYEWDEAKRRANLGKHEIDFVAIYEFDWSTASSETDIRNGELRTNAYGYIRNRLHVVVFTEREVSTRIISIRKANPREVKRYEQER